MSDSRNDDAVLTVQTDSADSSMGWARLGERRWRCVVDAAGKKVPVDVVRAAYSRAANVEVVADARWDTATLEALGS